MDDETRAAIGRLETAMLAGFARIEAAMQAGSARFENEMQAGSARFEKEMQEMQAGSARLEQEMRAGFERHEQEMQAGFERHDHYFTLNQGQFIELRAEVQANTKGLHATSEGLDALRAEFHGFRDRVDSRFAEIGTELRRLRGRKDPSK